MHWYRRHILASYVYRPATPIHVPVCTHVSFQLPGIDSWTIEQIYERFDEPRTAWILRLDDQPLDLEVPPYTVESAYFSPDRKRPMKKIKIIDFGEASFSSEARVKSNTKWRLRPPETMSIGLPADIWFLACIVFGRK